MLTRARWASLIAIPLMVCAAAADVKSELREQQELFWKTAAERDATAMDALLADDYFAITRSGQTDTKKHSITFVKAQHREEESGVNPKM